MRTLGICLAPYGNDLDEFKHRMEEATFNAGPPQDSPTQPRACCHRIPRYLADEAQILPWSDVLLQETM
jgi:hypothetical protein